ncbi:MAG: hypothetical protein KJ578_06090 [Bacteroidetes bacterium]|jgi:uncharacterized protein involved in exopolysaccharide biosynthesis|nr:hypothetical protein [Bacteroidota bacterium]MDA3942699.1 Wzz/FepE/Etk N-terminal domain-containing protein [Bacteroidota bacterium]
MQEPVKGDINSFSLLKLVIDYKKPMLIVLAVTALLSFVFTSPYFITPLYKSITILYPTSTNSISKILLSTNFQTSKDLLEFGEDEQTEQMLQVLNSNKIKDKIIEKYDLMSHYGIRPNEKYRNTKLYETYEDRIKFRRTEYTAVKITVLDKSPVMAANISNDIAELFDSTMNNMRKEVSRKAFKIVESEYLQLRAEVQQMEDSLNKLRKLGIHDYESQAEMMNQQLAIELAKNNRAGIQAIEERLKVLAEYGGDYVSIRDNLEHERKQLSQIKAKYEEAKVDATQNLPHKFVVSSAYEAERKSYPIRWLIAAIALTSTFVLMLLILAVIDRMNLWQPQKKSLNDFTQKELKKVSKQYEKN